jgi:beta-lactamase regulating signal transducer with metallopeptidase domain
MGIRQRLELRLSEHVEVPSLIGLLRPLLLVPPGVDDSLAEEAIEAILAHELAHVRRRDFAANLVQGLVEIPLFFHPAAHWISGRIREERECACDAMAARATQGGVIAYIKALLDLEGMRPPAPAPALGISGGDLLRRVRRLTKAGFRSRPGRALSVGVAGVAAIALLALGFWMEKPSTHLAVTVLMKQDLAEQQIVVSEESLQSSLEHEMEMQRRKEIHAGR